jgi:hypothetical protein
MITHHDHRPGEFDADHCRACARETGLLHHDHRVQREEDALRAAQRSAWRARSLATWALCSSGAGILLAAIAPGHELVRRMQTMHANGQVDDKPTMEPTTADPVIQAADHTCGNLVLVTQAA